MGCLIRQCLDARTLSKAVENRLAVLLKDTSPDVEELGPVLEEVAAASKTHFIVIDAIDECEKIDQDALLVILRKLTESSRITVKIFLASRESISIEINKCFKSYYHRTMNCQEAQKDIDTYIEDSINEKLNTRTLVVGQKELIVDIRNALVNNAQGMYVY